jgi:hypothetical protein
VSFGTPTEQQFARSTSQNENHDQGPHETGDRSQESGVRRNGVFGYWSI